MDFTDEVLPAGWRKRITPKGVVYYINSKYVVKMNLEEVLDYEENMSRSGLSKGGVTRSGVVKRERPRKDDISKEHLARNLAQSGAIPSTTPKPVDGAPGWREMYSVSKQRVYYYNINTRESTWRHPVTNVKSEVVPADVLALANSIQDMQISKYRRRTGERSEPRRVAETKQEERKGGDMDEESDDDDSEPAGAGISRTENRTTRTIPKTVALDTVGKMIVKDCDKLRGLSWNSNSCYMDSVLMALMAVPSHFIQTILSVDLARVALPATGFTCNPDPVKDLRARENIQTILNDIYDFIHGKTRLRRKTCKLLRRAFRDCPHRERFSGHGLKDAGEFLSYLLSIFPVNTAVKERVTYVTNTTDPNPSRGRLLQTSKAVDRNASVVQYVHINEVYFNEYTGSSTADLVTVSQDDRFNENNLFYHEETGNVYRRRIEELTILNAPFIIFNVQRKSLYIPFDNTELNYDWIITLQNGKQFNLTAIVCYISMEESEDSSGSSDEEEMGHYVTYFKCKEKWYYYDGIKSKKITYVGIGDNLEHLEVNPKKNGTLFFSTPA